MPVIISTAVNSTPIYPFITNNGRTLDNRLSSKEHADFGSHTSRFEFNQRKSRLKVRQQREQ